MKHLPIEENTIYHFIGRDIYVWVGKDSKRLEKLKAISAANQIRDQDHAGRANVNIVGM